MIWVGLTGGIASGKTSVVEQLKRNNIPVIDADQIAKQVVTLGSPGLSAVVKEFGQDILDSDGTLNRRKLGQKVFGHRESLQKLESILHPLIRAEVELQKRKLESSGALLAVYDIPLLFETQSQSQFDYIVVVSCTYQQQFDRIAQRNNLSSEEIRERLAAQVPLADKVKQAHFVVINDKDFSHLQKEIERLLTWFNQISYQAKS